MTHVGRRKLVKFTGAGVVAAKLGGIAAILAAGRAPAYSQGTTLHWLRWSDFVPASDEVLRREIAPACEKALGLKLSLETVNANDIQARITSSIQSGTGPDMIHVRNNWAQLYRESVADVSDVAEEIGKVQGGFYETSRAIAHDGERWLAVPWSLAGVQIAYRKSWFAEIGYADGKFPQTWEEYRAAGKKLKATGRPLGQTLGHTFGDAPLFTYPYLWSWGGREVEEDGKTVVLDGKATLESVKFMTGFWADAHDEGGLAWDDTNNNRAFLSGTCAATSNAASIYIEAKHKPNAYRTETDAPLWQDIRHASLPAGPAGQFSMHGPSAHMVMGYSKQQRAAKDFLRWIGSTEIYDRWFTSQKGYSVGATAVWEKHALWNEDPVMLPFRAAARSGRFVGYAGPSDRAAAEVLTKHIVTDMYAKAVQGMPPVAAVKWADGLIAKIHA